MEVYIWFKNGRQYRWHPVCKVYIVHVLLYYKSIHVLPLRSGLFYIKENEKKMLTEVAWDKKR